MTVRNLREPSAVFPVAASDLGVRSLAREMEAFAKNAFDPPAWPVDVPHGDGHTVLVLPGFLAGDWTTSRLRDFLRSLDYRVETADILFNAGPTRPLLNKLEAKFLELHIATGTKLSLVGVSLGGVLARDLARKFPDKVRSVVTLCSPIRMPVVTPLQPLAQALSPFHERSWVSERDAIAGKLSMPVTAIYTEQDGIVDWRQCLQDESQNAINVCVPGAHLTIGSNPEAQRIVARALVGELYRA
jgi:pimeloyl-ACP methyl ester carboxylesterase